MIRFARPDASAEPSRRVVNDPCLAPGPGPRLRDRTGRPGTGAQAGLLPVSVSITPEADKFRWTYAIVLPTDAMIRAGDYFTIYDFAGLVAGSESQPADWAFATVEVRRRPGGGEPAGRRRRCRT